MTNGGWNEKFTARLPDGTNFEFSFVDLYTARNGANIPINDNLAAIISTKKMLRSQNEYRIAAAALVKLYFMRD